jgi:hypothetical protein
MVAEGENQLLTTEYTENTEGEAAEAVATYGAEGATTPEAAILNTAKGPWAWPHPMVILAPSLR